MTLPPSLPLSLSLSLCVSGNVSGKGVALWNVKPLGVAVAANEHRLSSTWPLFCGTLSIHSPERRRAAPRRAAQKDAAITLLLLALLSLPRGGFPPPFPRSTNTRPTNQSRKRTPITSAALAATTWGGSPGNNLLRTNMSLLVRKPRDSLAPGILNPR
jgi:hypothetical protein